MAKNISRSRKCDCVTRSALDKNLSAKAISNKPRTTLTEFNHPPDLGNELSHPGNAANKPNGSANAKEKPSIPKLMAEFKHLPKSYEVKIILPDDKK